MNIDGAVVAITGASGGMGEASARYLAERGARVVLGARNGDRLRDVVREITSAGGAATHLPVDVRRREDVRALAQCAVATFGRLDVFVANAGAMPIGPVDDLALDDWETMVDVNVKGVLWSIAAALPIFREQGSGHFIAVASTAARKIVPNMAVYSGTKAAVVAICDGLRQELAGELRVTTLTPGFTATGFADHIRDEALRERIAAGGSIAMPPETIAQAIAYAIGQPAGVNVGEIVIRPTAQA
ncbi:SDR family oxidoreductase [Sphingomonas melonis]|uniref:NADP-dependent 3-hydroxy acid dehydrogenase YdfG n=1 Tax=Sphingomonas melonis TaxID=152682 RepID=A0A7Y9K3H6_9SPHN|nr:SDR family oxidoreductase [Sphingomonas melonis]NYD91024.1 NADP-dependent 3-hydroxy acid dehydrogenase YdfG [Sphingomonas melonis]